VKEDKDIIKEKASQKLDMVIYTCGHSTQKADVGGSGV
jgi:hypothetical protein